MGAIVMNFNHIITEDDVGKQVVLADNDVVEIESIGDTFYPDYPVKTLDRDLGVTFHKLTGEGTLACFDIVRFYDHDSNKEFRKRHFCKYQDTD